MNKQHSQPAARARRTRAALGAAALATCAAGMGQGALQFENGFWRSTEAREHVVAIARHDVGGGMLQNRVHRVDAEVEVGAAGGNGTVVMGIGGLPGIFAMGWQYGDEGIERFYAGGLPGDCELASGAVRLKAVMWPGSQGKMRVEQTVSALDGTVVSKEVFVVPLLGMEAPEAWGARAHVSGDVRAKIEYSTCMQSTLLIVR
ncbi:MAG: hypothetical protein FWF96_01550 [Kiritimatiellaeota bacterium]|nr:hypothetical protein [Kiritimatiellota bacterium]